VGVGDEAGVGVGEGLGDGVGEGLGEGEGVGVGVGVGVGLSELKALEFVRVASPKVKVPAHAVAAVI
jgi:hypothetical protein